MLLKENWHLEGFSFFFFFLGAKKEKKQQDTWWIKGGEYNLCIAGSTGLWAKKKKGETKKKSGGVEEEEEEEEEAMVSKGEWRRERETVMDVRFFSPFKKKKKKKKHQTQQRRGLDSLFKMSPNICFIFMMVALLLRCPLQHSGDSISASDYPHYPPMHNL